MSTDQRPPRGYDTQATGTGQLLVCRQCGALIGSVDLARRAHDSFHAMLWRAASKAVS